VVLEVGGILDQMQYSGAVPQQKNFMDVAKWGFSVRCVMDK